MIVITLEGPIGSGKSKIGSVIEGYCTAMGMSVVKVEETIDTRQFKSDIVIIEKQVSNWGIT